MTILTSNQFAVGVYPGGGGAIQTQANSMSSNTWQELPDNGLTTLAIKTDEPGIGLLFNFSHNLFWNSNAKELHFRGGIKTTGGASGNQRHVRFNDGVGTWDAVTPWGFGSQAHQWGHFCGDPVTGDLYFRLKGLTTIVKWDYTQFPGTGSWVTDHVGNFNNAGGPNAQALGYFPDLNGGVGGLVYMYSNGGPATIYATDETKQNWSSKGTLPGPISVEALMAYLPGQQWMMFGGGKGAFPAPNFQIGKMDANGVVTRLNDLPFGVGANTDGTIVGHPNGRVFGLDPSVSTTLYEYNEGADSWSASGLTQPTFTRGEMNAACMIPDFNVIFVVTTNNFSTSQWIYKL
jgi:hypothetical protein